MNDGEVFIMNNIEVCSMRKVFLGSVLVTLGLLPQVSASTVAQPTEFDITYLYPLLSALFVAGLLWKFFVPRQLSALQV
ncbi:MAG TPA: hypothetical protein D7I16_02490, partial [Candidatus Poseidoniales archaeon]